MGFLQRLFGGSRNAASSDELVPLLNGIVQPLQEGAVGEINAAVHHIQGVNSQGRFMLLMMHVCLASILHRLNQAGQTHLSSSFRDFAISQWDRPPNMTIDAARKLFAYSQQELGSALESPSENQLIDVGLTLLSMADPNQEHFTTRAALACGQAAYACWKHAADVTQSMFGIKRRIWTKQLKRAATIENCLKAGIFDRLVASHGYDASDNEPSDAELAVFGGAVNYILACDIQPHIQMLDAHSDAAETIQSLAHQILASDPNLERLVIRVLYEIASLAHMLRRDEWATEFLQHHPRIMEVLTVARPTHPELFRDVEETHFKALFAGFIDRYLPDMKDSARSFFA